MNRLQTWISGLGIGEVTGPLLGLTALAVVSTLVYFTARRVMVLAIRKAADRSATHWDDELVRASFFARIGHFAPALVVWWGVALVPGLDEAVDLLIRRVTVAVMILVAALSLSSFLTAVNAIYSAKEDNRSRPIKGYLQVAKIVLTILSGILIIATLVDRSPLIFLSGLGAMAAVLLIVFRDTLLSLVASIQLTGNDMVHVGDWIEMPQFDADGDVIDVALHTVKVQNWDKTITTIPTHKLIDHSFKNWRGMSQSGGRRIKRSILIDINTIRFLDEPEVEHFGRFALLADYISDKRSDIDASNAALEGEEPCDADIRRLTNVGTLRTYLQHYLENHPKIHRGMTLMVRQLAPGNDGLPLEIYCFTNTTDWGEYEGIQADIMDHALALLPEFGLRAFQTAAGRDLEAIANATSHDR